MLHTPETYLVKIRNCCGYVVEAWETNLKLHTLAVTELMGYASTPGLSSLPLKAALMIKVMLGLIIVFLISE